MLSRLYLFDIKRNRKDKNIKLNTDDEICQIILEINQPNMDPMDLKNPPTILPVCWKIFSSDKHSTQVPLYGVNVTTYTLFPHFGQL